jgi:hypothetical protein
MSETIIQKAPLFEFKINVRFLMERDDRVSSVDEYLEIVGYYIGYAVPAIVSFISCGADDFEVVTITEGNDKPLLCLYSKGYDRAAMIDLFKYIEANVEDDEATPYSLFFREDWHSEPS